MRDDDITSYYEPNRTGIDRLYGRITGIKHWPVVLNKISRCTLVPKSGYRENFLGYSRNFVDHVLRGEKMDVVRTIMHQIQHKKKNLEVNIYFAPYIMSFIIQETNYDGPSPEKHTPYKPFSNDRDFRQRALTPINEVDDPYAPFNPNASQEAPAQEAVQDVPPPPQPGQQFWEPPAGYFDSYFTTLQNNINASFSSHFESYGEQVNQRLNTMEQNFYGYVDNRLNTLANTFTTLCITQS
jgi:hypothetical protein